MERFCLIFVSPGGVRGENSEKLEFDDLLNENAMFLRSQVLQHEVKMVPKRAERRKKSSEEAKSEQRGDKSALQSVRGALWGDIRRCRGSPGEGRWNARLGVAPLVDLEFRRVWPLKVRESVVIYNTFTMLRFP